MANLQGFDATKVEPSIAFTPIPAGEYRACITSSEMKATKSGTGQFLELTIQVVDGPCKGRKLKDRLNIRNASDKASAIARSQLSSICRAVNVMKPNDSSELHNKPLAIRIKVVPDNQDPLTMRNEIVSYAALNGTEGVLPPPTNDEPPAAATSTEETPW